MSASGFLSELSIRPESALFAELTQRFDPSLLAEPAQQRSELSASDIERARQHGGPSEAELRTFQLTPDAVLDFSSSTNPYGPNPAVLRALQGAILTRYPDSSALRAREALGARARVGANEVVLGNGAAELLWSLARCLLRPGERALIAGPTFSEFPAAALAQGASVGEIRGRAETGFAIDLEALSEHARAEGARVLYLCSPNTPTGSVVAAEWLADWARQHPELWIVLDQSFLSLSENWADAELQLPANVIAVRSLTKDHGIPGVRVGYLLGTAELCRAVEAARPAWSTSAFAQAAALACASSDDFLPTSRERLLDDRRQLEHALGSLGIEFLPSRANFLVARVPQIARLRARLLSHHGILVRDCSSFGLPGFMRLGARPAADRERLLGALGAERRSPLSESR